MSNLKGKHRINFRDTELARQQGFCAWCQRGIFMGQEVNTLDHDHDCCGTGCECCIRGVVHAYCNRALHITEVNEHLQNDYSKAYFRREKPIFDWLKSKG